jgi:hypothetical protein
VGVGGARYWDVREWREGFGRGAWEVLAFVGASEESARDAAPEIVLPLRFLERTVTLEGIVVALLRGVGVVVEWSPIADPVLGEARGGVFTGAGSLLRAVWTRASRFCIFDRKFLRCRIEDD